MVGIYGMGGVGKTTLAKEVGKEVKQSNIFNTVVLATVSQTPNFKTIQGQIADSLSLRLEEESEDGRAKRLSIRLKNENKVLIILDDIWAKLDLTKMGILLDDGDQKSCKILLTTRREQVCNVMRCGSKISLNVLKEEEGLALLKRNAGIGDHDLPTLNALQKKVLENVRVCL
ncbi:putative Disease resistance protein family [Melia azedarach]|uniref:Disease resistance protein family n=1 Tax=Melia azedarach TaxID=155640 RepID=A0ACC1YKL3_MELAZ|nr:putative Disease resistance protein family [Melia azedarach]